MNVLLLLLFLQLPQEIPSDLLQNNREHRHIPTEEFPIPDWANDSAMREFLESQFRNGGDLDDWFRTPQERDDFLNWARQYMQDNPGASPEDMARHFMNRRGEPGGFNPQNLPHNFDPQRFQDVLRRMQNAQTRGGNNPFSNGNRSLFSERSTRWMERVMGHRNPSERLAEGANDLFNRFDGWLGRMGSNSGSGPINPPWNPGGNSNSGAGSNSSGGEGGGGTSGSTGEGPLRGMPGIEVPGFRGISSDVVLVIFILMITGVAIYLGTLWMGTRREGSDKKKKIRERWNRPTLPARFRTKQDFFNAYRALHRYVLQQRLTGLSHKDIAHATESGSAAELAQTFEQLYYDGETTDQDCATALPLCEKVLKESNVASTRTTKKIKK